MEKQLVLVYEYRQLTLKELFLKMNLLRNKEYQFVSVGSKYVTCIFTPKQQTLQLNREQLEWRINQ